MLIKKSSVSRFASFLLLALRVISPGAGKDEAGGTLSSYMENDLFAGTDRYYTSGVKWSWSSYDLEKFSDTPYASPFLPLFELLPYINKTGYQKTLVPALGQNIYTPDNTETSLLVEDDRPYAGWLCFGTGVIWKNAEVRNSLVMDIGVVGPWAYGQEAQRLIHDFRGLGHPNGWDNQLHNELGVSLVYERMWRWPKHERRSGLDWELLPHAGAAIGNVYTYANLGAELRAGLNLPDDFVTASIGPSATTSTPVDGNMRADRSLFDLGLYLFARVDGRAVGHNIFLDGNTFGDCHSVGHNPFVADLSVDATINQEYKNRLRPRISHEGVPRTTG